MTAAASPPAAVAAVPLAIVRFRIAFPENDSCSERCRSRLYRRARSPFAHQRRIRNHFSRSAPRPVAASLDGYTVRMISRVEAEPIILKYEWLGSIGQAYLFAGLFSPSGDIQGVAAFSNGYPNSIRDIIGGPALCLQRGACVHYAPHNARSFLINRACRLIHRSTGKARFFAYCDPEAGEYGGVYQASNWTYLGQGPKGKSGYRTTREAVLPPGLDPKNPANWTTTRVLRIDGRHLSYAEARAMGYRIEQRAAKHLYAFAVDRRDRAAWPAQPYPCPRPELKRKSGGCARHAYHRSG